MKEKRKDALNRLIGLKGAADRLHWQSLRLVRAYAEAHTAFVETVEALEHIGEFGEDGPMQGYSEHTCDTLERLETEAGACRDMVDDLHGRIGRHIAQHRSN